MRNNEYTATPDWFGDSVITEETSSTITNNYYSGGITSSIGSGITTINFYNKYVKKPYTILEKDLYLSNTAIIAVDSKPQQVTEEPLQPPEEELKSDLGKLVQDENWYTSTFYRVLSGTKVIAKFKANTKNYGLVFYDKHNLPISGFTPTVDGQVTIDVPEGTYYLRVCSYIEPIAPVAEDLPVNEKFFVYFEGINLYNTANSDKAYLDGFIDFTQPSPNVDDALNQDTVSKEQLNILLQHPLGYTIDKNNNVRITFDLDFLGSSQVGKNFVTTLKDDPLDIWSRKTFRDGFNLNSSLIHEKNGVIYIEADVAIKGGAVTHALSDSAKISTIMDGVVTDETTVSKEGGILHVIGGGGGGTGGFGNVEPSVTNNGNVVTSLSVSPDGKTLVYHLDKKFLDENELRLKFVTIDTEQTVTGLKSFTQGIYIGDKSKGKCLYERDGVVYLEGDLAVTGGVVTHALGNMNISDVMDGVFVDNVTIIKDPKNNGKLTVVGGGGDIDPKKMWELLAATTNELINKSHLQDALKGYLKNIPLATSTKVGGIKVGFQQLNKNYPVVLDNSGNAYVNVLWEKGDTVSYSDLTGTQDYVTIGTLTINGRAQTVYGKMRGITNIYNTTSSSSNISLSQTGAKNMFDELTTTFTDLLKKYVTLDTTQTITGLKYFNNGLFIGPSSPDETGKIYRKNGVTYINGDVAVTGGIVTHALGNTSISTVMDGVYVDDVTITKNADNQLVVKGGGGTDFDSTKMWQLLANTTTELINPTHLTTALNGYIKTIPFASNSKVGGIKTGYQQSGKNYPVNTDSYGRAYVNIPWEKGDTVSYTDDTGNSNYVKIGTITINNQPQTVYGKLRNITNLYDVVSPNSETSFSQTGAKNMFNNLSTAISDSLIAVDNKLKDYVTLKTEQDIIGLKYFDNGLYIGSKTTNGNKIYQKDGNVYIDGNLAVTGGVTVYAKGDESLPARWLPIEGGTLKGSVIIDGSNKDNPLIIDDTIGIYPSVTNHNTLGSTDFKFLEAHVNNIYTAGVHYDGSVLEAVNNDNYILLAGGGVKNISEIGGGGGVTGDYLPLTGGKITGNLRLQNAGSGSVSYTSPKLNFGDLDECYIQEASDGWLTIRTSRGIDIKGGKPKASGYIVDGFSDSYVVLAGGGTKPLSEFGSGGGGNSYVLPKATSSTLGGVKIGSGINVASDGTISVSGGGTSPSGDYLPITGGSLKGNLTIANSSNSALFIRDQDVKLSQNYTTAGAALDVTSKRGILASGFHHKTNDSDDYVLLAGGGTRAISSFGGDGNYVLPKASASTLGGVKIGSGINIASDGTISVSGGGSVTGDYLPLTGGTLSGKLKVASDILITKDSYAWGLFPYSNDNNTIGSSSEYWYQGYITNVHGTFHHKTNDSNDYVLLAGGGTKLLAELGGGGILSGTISEYGYASNKIGDWSSTREKIGTYKITHNLGTTVYSFTATPYQISLDQSKKVTSSLIQILEKNTTYVRLRVLGIEWNTTQKEYDCKFDFTIIK